MNREILFRGKRIDNGEWVEGWLMKYEYHKMHIHCYYPCPVAMWKQHEVDPKTVGQFTGITDKNKAKIFEGDVVKKMAYDYNDDPSGNWDSNDKQWDNYPECMPLTEANRDEVVMNRFPIFWLKNESFGYEGEDLQDNDEYEVIGNIHDNPELPK